MRGDKLYKIYEKLDRVLQKLPEFQDAYKRHKHILENQLYGISLSEDFALFSSRRIFGDPFSDKITQINNYESLLLDSDYSTIIGQIHSSLQRTKFDVVICETPLVHTRDIFINYVELCMKLKENYCLAAIPGKWALKKTGRYFNKLEQFNSLTNAYIDKVIFVRGDEMSSNERNYSGLTLVSIGKVVKNSYDIKFMCDKNAKLNESWQTRQKTSINLMQSSIISLIEKIYRVDRNGSILSVCDGSTTRGKYFRDDRNYLFNKDAKHTIAVRAGQEIKGYTNLENIMQIQGINQYKAVYQNVQELNLNNAGKILNPCEMMMYLPNEVPNISYSILKFFDSDKECESFMSFMNTKIIGLLKYFGNFNRVIQPETFRLIPNPNDWSVTYVDSPHPGVLTDEKGYYTYNGERYCSLYVRYKLSKEDIDIIESIIKARK